MSASERERLWLVIPAWREAERIDLFASLLWPALAASGLPVTVQIVDDGSPAQFADALQERCRSWHDAYGFVRPLLKLPENRGKGGAVYAGWDAALAAGAGWLGFCDADGSVGADEIVRFARLALAMPRSEPVMLLASRHAAGARACWSTPLRLALSRIFVAWVRNSTRLPVSDSQCGAKFLPAKLYGDIRSQLRVERFAFDVELLSTAYRANARLREEPVVWSHLPSDRLNLLRDGFAAAREVRRIGSEIGARSWR